MMKSKILSIPPSVLFNEFISICTQLFPAKNIKKLKEVAQTSIRYYSGDVNFRKQNRELMKLESIWYKSLRTHNPAYSVYGSDYYLSDIWACWAVYSRKYLTTIQNNTSIISSLGKVRTVVDLGCGLGYTTASLSQIFSRSTVYGTNIKNTEQMIFCNTLADRYNLVIVDSIDAIQLNKIDLLFASEYFEHFESPIAHLFDVYTSLRPRNIIIANSFNTKSIGHFHSYVVNGGYVDESEVSRLFNKELISLGYVKQKTNLWNNRPAYWKLA